MSFIVNPYVLGSGAGGGGGGGSPVLTFDPLTDILNDSIVTDASVTQFIYSGAGESPGGNTLLDAISPDVSVTQFIYSGAGESPGGNTIIDVIAGIDASIVDFSYTT